jgi:hypothetical protein
VKAPNVPGPDRRGSPTASAGPAAAAAAGLTAPDAQAAIYLDPVYRAELKRREAIQAKSTRSPLDTFREQRPPAYPLSQAGPACSRADHT